MDIVIKEGRLRRFCENICLKVGMLPQDTFVFVDTIIFASLRGIDSHGIMRFPFYIKRLERGGARVKPCIKKIEEGISTVLVDGDSGMGQVVSMYATNEAIAKAQKSGVSVVGVRNSSHFGAASYYSVKMAEKGMVGVSMSNTLPIMAAWGGSSRAIGNNPISVAIPYEEGKPIVLDIAMSKVAGGKVRLAAKEGRKIPFGWVLDIGGKETNDPVNFVKGGALLPFGEHKGYGLAVIVEVLAGVLTGAGMLHEVKSWLKTPEAPTNTGHCFMAISIESFMPMRDFKKRLDWMVKELKSTSLLSGFEEILVPGEIEYRIERQRKIEGIPVSIEIWEDLKRLSKYYGEPLDVS
ncbi:MAG: Ldh family oxidoreductase [Synergistetes bacterium]|nr:Ldh family oxidoreductase [Synergistota bacterium]